MVLYLDTEFNGFKGKLISIALVHPNGSQWYEALQLPDDVKLDPWVKEHVVPFLNKIPIRKVELRTSLFSYLSSISNMERLHIIADWPEDFIKFMDLTFDEGGKRWSFNYTTQLINSPDSLPSKTPHNALSDAIALMEWHQGVTNATTITTTGTS